MPCRIIIDIVNIVPRIFFFRFHFYLYICSLAYLFTLQISVISLIYTTILINISVILTIFNTNKYDDVRFKRF